MKIFLKLILFIAAIAAGRLAYDKVLDLPVFELKKITVEGNNYADSDSIIAASGFELGESNYKQDIKFAVENLSRHPGVVTCTIDRGFLSDINIRIDMAEPALLIHGSRLFGLSREGIVLPIDNLEIDLPLITGRKFHRVKCYDRIMDPEVSYALELYNSLAGRSPELCRRLSEINFSGKDFIKLCLSPDGTVVVMDKHFDEYDLQRLCVLKDSGILQGRKIYDLRFGPVIVESSAGKGTL